MHIGFVLLNCDLGAEEYIIDELRQIPQIKNAYITFGAYDIITEIHAASQEEFEKTVSMNIRRLSRVVSTMTLNVVTKDEWHLYWLKMWNALQQVDYSGTVWALSHNDPEPLVEHAIKKIQECGVKKEDIKVVDAPNNPQVGEIVVEIWPHEIVIARIRTIRGESFISGTEFTVELKSDESGTYID